MELDQLRALVTVVDCETFDAAAGELRVTPSATSQRIKALERSLGCVLVHRNKPVRPTRSGERLLPSARQLLHLADEGLLTLREPAAGSGEGASLPLTVVADPDSIATWLPSALREISCHGRIALEVVRGRAGRHRAAPVGPGRSCHHPRPSGCSRLQPPPARDDGLSSQGDWGVRGAVAPRRATTSALSLAPVVVFDRLDQCRPTSLSKIAPRSAPPHRHYMPDPAQHVEAIRAGIGWGMVPDQQDPDRELQQAAQPTIKTACRIFMGQGPTYILSLREADGQRLVAIRREAFPRRRSAHGSAPASGSRRHGDR
ncbi:LysR family transcriptional regulator [Sinomonas sp. G460-2]|uniref:LysR family transcriptional regulator n=1 Tax=Sinomonas sp. G460-2 TaxID=3393464 RepID=UPI0039EF43C1